MRNANPVCPERVRNIRACTFGWVDHNFLHRGFFARLSQGELLLYFFLLTVADRNGVSFYDYERICQTLSLPVDDFVHARNQLCERGLIAYRDGVFQVLSLPAQVGGPTPSALPRGASDFQTLKTIFAQAQAHRG